MHLSVVVIVASILRSEVRASNSAILGRYSSLFSLQCLDGLSLVAIACANGRDAFVKTSKFELLVQLNRKLVNGNRSVLDFTLDLDGDMLSVGLSTGTAESQHNGVDLVRIGDDVRSHGERHTESGRLFAFDFLFNGNREDIDWHLGAWLFISKRESAAILPWPVGVVENIDLDHFSGTWSEGDDILRLASAHGTGFFPVFLAIEVPVLVVATTFVGSPVLLEVFKLLLNILVVEVANEFVHHVLEAASTTTSAAATAATTSVMTTTRSKLVDHLLDEVARVTAFRLFLRAA